MYVSLSLTDSLRRLRVNFEDVRRFGFRFLLRHLPRLTGADTVVVRIPGIGEMHMRAGESDVAAVRQVFGAREYDIGGGPGARLNARYRAILDASAKPVIVDAGANIGAASLWFRAAYPEAAIVAVEPEPGNVAVLRRNLDGVANAIVIQGGVGGRPGFVDVTNDGLGWAARTQRADAGLPIITMADAFSSVAGGIPFVAKVDIEGFESDLFSANTEWLDHVYALFVEPHDWMLPGRKTSRTLQCAMGTRDFEIFICGENLAYIRV